MSHFYETSGHQAYIRAVRRRHSSTWQQDPVYGPLSQLAQNAEPMTTDLWDAMQRGFRHAPIRPEARSPWGRALPRHDNLLVYGAKAVKLG